MKYFFIVNPVSGKDNKKQKLIDSIKQQLKDTGADYHIQKTLAPGDATKYVRAMCEKYSEPVRFIACGGDGTINEVANGLIGFEHASLGCIPCGTGNDFVKSLRALCPDEQIDFFDIKKQLTELTYPVDLIKVGDRYSVNVCNMGFDADIALNMNLFRKVPFIKSESGAYNMSVVYTLFGKRGDNVKITIDDSQVIEQACLLTLVGNGNYYGGGYNPTPLAKIDDGYLDLCVVKNISLDKIAQIIGVYKKGEHLEHPKIKKFVTYKQCKKIKVEFKKPVSVCIDGEIETHSEVTFEIAPKIIKVALPY